MSRMPSTSSGIKILRADRAAIGLAAALALCGAQVSGAEEAKAAEPLRFQSGNFVVEGTLSPQVNPSKLFNAATGAVHADLPYRYSIGFRKEGNALTGSGLRYLAHKQGTQPDGTTYLEITGHFHEIPPDVLQVVHTFRGRPDGGWIEEEIELINPGKTALRITDLDLAFGKSLYNTKTSQWDPLMSAHELMAVPFLVDPQAHIHRHPLGTLQNGNEGWKYQGKPRLLSEAWALTNGRDGFLFSHYSQDLIRMARAQAIYNEGGIELRFGGSGAEIDNEEANTVFLLQPGARQSLGTARYAEFAGGHREGATLYRSWMDSLGHAKPAGYRPPLHWEPHYDNPWWRYSREHILDQAAKGAEMGCELLYLDPAWDKVLGGSEWDEARLGDLAGFNDVVKNLRLQGTGLHIMGDSVGPQADEFLKQFPGAQRRNAKGEPVLPQNPCFASKAWQEGKRARLDSLLREDDLAFLMFDFHAWRGSCWDESHGHEVPLIRRDHAKAYYNLIAGVKAARPDVLIEAHDAIVAGQPKVYLPKYYGHTGPHRWDEHWAFEFMHNPLLDIIEGNALALYYYRLAYSIPMYLHIPMYADNDNLLMFWWYASTVQHLGLGGTRADFATQGGGGLHPLPQSRFAAYHKAVAEYKSLRKFLIDGEFHGLGEYAHLHLRRDLGEALLVVFNLNQETEHRTLLIRPEDLGVKSIDSVEGATLDRSANPARIHVEIPPVAPKLIRIKLRKP